MIYNKTAEKRSLICRFRSFIPVTIKCQNTAGCYCHGKMTKGKMNDFAIFNTELHKLSIKFVMYLLK